MERLRCVVERITYQNEQNGYSVIKCRAKGYSDLVTVVGAMPEVHVGAVLSLTGEWKMDSKYGRQFSVESFEETLPATVLGIEKYLGSGLVKGIGPKFAKRIVQEFGSDTLQVIEDEPDRLLQVPGIGSATMSAQATLPEFIRPMETRVSRSYRKTRTVWQTTSGGSAFARRTPSPRRWASAMSSTRD